MRAVTLFSGAGGADVGLRDAGCEHLLGVEWDDDAASAARAAGFPVVTGDVRDLSLYAGLDSVDLLWASPPCQDWSTAGNRAGADGERNGWPWTIDVIDAIQPTWLLAENVVGMVQAEAREYVDGFLLPELRKRFAHVDLRVLDAADYGVPQRRRRVIIAAGPHAMQWPEPTHSGQALAKAKWVTGDYWREWAEPSDVAIATGLRGSDWSVDSPAPTLRDGNGTAGYYLHGMDPVGHPSRQEARWLAQRQQVGLFASEPPEFARKPWRTVRQALGLGGVLAGGDPETVPDTRSERPRPSDEPAPAIGTKGNMYSASDRGTQRRRLTVEECATLQGFPAGYPFHGTKTCRYRQVGNAVPPPLARVLGGAVLRAHRQVDEQPQH